MFTLKASVSRIFCAVSFNPDLPTRATDTEMIGGLVDTPLKKEKGAKLSTPEPERVPTQAMGLGTIMEVNSL